MPLYLAVGDRMVQHVGAIEGPRCDEIRFVDLAEGLHRIVADAAEALDVAAS